jgi:serine/threonine protein kinase
MVEGTLVGAYRVLKQIGEGGMGSVWIAEHTLLGRRAALKLLHPRFSSQPEMVTRFFNEARASTAIPDPGIVQIFDFGHDSDDNAFIAMELLEGEGLDARLRRGPLQVGEALRIMRQVASSLGAAHVRKIVHRDLKPENIYIVRDPEVPSGERAKVLDFGIAKLVDNPSGVKTDSAALLGTPLYMSPEQCRAAGEVDQRSDVYSLGCVLYTLLVGRPPFEAAGVGDIIVMHIREVAEKPSRLRSDVPHEVDALIAKCMEKDLELRFANGTELASAIEQLIAKLGSALDVRDRATMATLPPAGSRGIGVITTLSSSAASVRPTLKGPRRRWLIGGSLALLVCGAAIVWQVSRSSSKQPAEEPVAKLVAAAPVMPDPRIDQAKSRLAAVLGGFVRWSASHGSDPCPVHDELAGFVEGGLVDPWNHPLSITCTEQPSTQMIGVSSMGPDGAPNTSDDVTSWSLGPEVTGLVHGPRWQPKPATVAAPIPVVKPRPVVRKPPVLHAGSATPPKPPVQTDDGIPTHR